MGDGNISTTSTWTDSTTPYWIYNTNDTSEYYAAGEYVFKKVKPKKKDFILEKEFKM